SLLLVAALAAGCAGGGPPPDEAKARRFGGKAVTPAELEEAAKQYYPPASANYFEDMDCVKGGDEEHPPEKLALSDEEVIGRNAWVLWAGGNEAFWDWLALHSYGSFDLLKLVDSADRGKRFAKAGVITEPGTRPPTEEETREASGVRYARPV